MRAQCESRHLFIWIPQETDTSKNRMKALLQVIFACLMLVVSASDCKDKNVALRGRATQSSVYGAGKIVDGYLALALNAIDGNLDPEYYHGSCSHTNTEDGPWWRLDMLDEYYITRVSITNRNAGPERLNGAEILIGNSLVNNGNNNPRCAVMNNIGASETMTFECHGMLGRYLNVVIPGKTTVLTLCEVQVFGVFA
ncbi:fucolectin-1-like [Lissotriton helveticus]